ncbi:hypothetical protein J6590_075269 [Homalodisca vitripennis]|nr:hypothetical protein J6590_075269 [Homalodisca vitripennis]
MIWSSTYGGDIIHPSSGAGGGGPSDVTSSSLAPGLETPSTLVSRVIFRCTRPTKLWLSSLTEN